MKTNKQNSANIIAVEFCVPEKVLDNKELASIFGSLSEDMIYKNTGIRRRHIADQNVCVSDMGIKAATSLFEKHRIARDDIGMLILCTQGPDYFVPATSCIMQDILGLPVTCAAFDMNLGCSGYVYGLAIANAFIKSNMADNILLIVGDISSRTLNARDRSVRLLFGDGVSATLIGKRPGIAEIVGDFVLGTDGSGYDNIIIPAGALRMPKTAETAVEKEDSEGNFRSLENTHMDGKEVFLFTLKRVPEAINGLLEKARIGIEEVDWFVFHQANKFILDVIAKKMKIAPAKILLSLEDYGNTSSASIPITFKVAQDMKTFKNGDLIMLIGFGVGNSWGANLLRWSKKN